MDLTTFEENSLIVFHTHKLIENFITVGFTKEQAELIIQAQLNIVEKNLANKKDLETAKQEGKENTALIQKDIENLRQKGERDLENLKQKGEKELESLKKDGEKNLESLKADNQKI